MNKKHHRALEEIGIIFCCCTKMSASKEAIWPEKLFIGQHLMVTLKSPANRTAYKSNNSFPPSFFSLSFLFFFPYHFSIEATRFKAVFYHQ